MSTHLAQNKLQMFLIRIFFQTHIRIKVRNSISFGANHLLYELRLVRTHCNEQEMSIATTVLQTNSFYAHPEAILLSMLGE